MARAPRLPVAGTLDAVAESSSEHQGMIIIIIIIINPLAVRSLRLHVASGASGLTIQLYTCDLDFCLLIGSCVSCQPSRCDSKANNYHNYFSFGHPSFYLINQLS